MSFLNIKASRHLVTALGIALGMSSAHAEWKRLSENEVQANYVDVGSLFVMDGVSTVTVLYDFRKSRMFFDKEVRSTINRYKFDCLAGTLAVVDSTMYSGPMATGSISDSATFSTAWKPVFPSTPAEDFLYFACGLRSTYPVS